MNPVEFEINPETGCWDWLKAISDTGYGVKWNGHKLVPAHRFYFEKYKQPIPEGYDIDHLCKRHCCVNPDHLEAVTRAENAHRGKGTKLSMEQAKEIIDLNSTGVGYRRLSKMFGVHRSTIQSLVVGRNWKTCLSKRKQPSPRVSFILNKRAGAIKKAA